MQLRRWKKCRGVAGEGEHGVRQQGGGHVVQLLGGGRAGRGARPEPAAGLGPGVGVLVTGASPAGTERRQRAPGGRRVFDVATRHPVPAASAQELQFAPAPPQPRLAGGRRRRQGAGRPEV